MVDKKDIFVYDVDDFKPCSTVSQDYILETIKLLKSKSHEVKLQMNKNNGQILQRNMGIRRNINFMVNFNLETEIVTRTDDEGSKNFIVKAENPFEPNLDYIADDKDFFTEQTEDEDEFREISGYESKKRDKRSTVVQSDQEKGVVKQNMGGLQKITASKQLPSNISDSKEKSSTNSISTLKKSIDQMSLNEITENKKPSESQNFPFPKRVKAPSAPHKFKRNIFANFTPDLNQKIRNYELLLPYHTWMIIKSPCKERRKQVSKQIYREITGHKRRRSTISVDIQKPSNLNYHVDNMANVLQPKEISFKEIPNIQSMSTCPSDKQKYTQNTVEDSDLVNTFFIRAESNSDETSQIF